MQVCRERGVSLFLLLDFLLLDFFFFFFLLLDFLSAVGPGGM